MNLLLGLIFAFSFSSIIAEEINTIEIASLEYCPLICDATKEPFGRKGLMVDIVEEIFQRENIKIKVTLMPFNRAILEVTKGTFDGFLGGEVSQAPELLFPLNPICINHAQMFTLINNQWSYKGIQSLEKIKLVAVKGFGYANRDIDQYISNNQNNSVVLLTGDNTTERALELLKQEKADAFIDGHLIFHYIKSMTSDHKKYSYKAGSPVLGTFRNYISFSPKAKNKTKWAQIVDKQMPKLIEEGFVRKIYQNYGIPVE